MTISLKHAFVNPKSDGGDATVVRPSNWNAEHVLNMSSGFVLGRTSVGDGVVEELSAAATRGLLNVSETGVFAGINTRVASYTLVLADQGKVIEMNVGSANTLTIPANADAAFPINTQITVLQYGTGQVTIAGAGGVTVRALGGALKTSGQYASASLYKRDTNEWVVFGALTI